MSIPGFYEQHVSENADFLELNKENLKHIKVLRLHDGDEIRVFNGKGLAVFCKLSVNGKIVTARVQYTETQPSPRKNVLIIAVLKHNAMDTVIRQAAELGVTDIYPVITKLTDVSLKHAVSRIERWKRITISACTQSERMFIPKIHSPERLENFDFKSLETSLTNPLKILYWEKSEIVFPSRKTKNILSSVTVIGPEGGLTEKEKDLFSSNEFHVLSLGNHILRADTAAVAGLIKTSLLTLLT